MFSLKQKQRTPVRSSELSSSPTELSIDHGRLDDEAILNLIDLIAEGRFDSVPEGDDRISCALHKLAASLQEAAKKDLSETVQFTIGLCDETIAAANMTRAVKEVDNRANAIAAASEELVASVGEISRASSHAASEMDISKQAAQKGIEASDKAIEVMHGVATAVNTAAGNVDSLSQASQHIGDIVKQIEDIAGQTNLLALNATIEAARAGEAGKGFAVVATEVKSLATQTAKATEDIRGRIDGLRNEMGGIIDSMQEGARVVAEGEAVIANAGSEMVAISERVSSANEKMHEIAGILEEQQQASEEVSQGIMTIASMSGENLTHINGLVDLLDHSQAIVSLSLASKLESDIPMKTVMVAKSDHMLWRQRLAAMAIGRESLNPNELADHHGCRLGKWYDAVVDQALKNNPAFKALEAPHRGVHASGIAAAQLYANQDLDGCLAEIDKVADASVDVIRLLDQLISDGQQ